MTSSNPRDGADKEAGLRFLAGVAMLVGATAYVATEVSGHPQALVVVAAGLVGMYVAMNIGANDVANNVGAAVGARALTMVGALAIAALFEAAGAVLAGGDVVGTISKGIIEFTPASRNRSIKTSELPSVSTMMMSTPIPLIASMSSA